MVRCARCDEAGLVELVDWSDAGRLRVYALAGIAPDAVALWRRDLARGSCDLARRERETEALVASAGPPTRLVARDNATGAVVRTVAWPRGARMPIAPWPERVGRTRDPRWRAALGLATDAPRREP